MEAIALTTPRKNDGVSRVGPGEAPSGLALTELEAAVLDACEPTEEWPERVVAGIDAAVRFVVNWPDKARAIGLGANDGADFADSYDLLVRRLAVLLRQDAPLAGRLPASTDEAVLGGIVGLVGDHIRIGRADRLLGLRPDLVLLALLPYLGFAAAREWANQFAGEEIH